MSVKEKALECPYCKRVIRIKKNKIGDYILQCKPHFIINCAQYRDIVGIYANLCSEVITRKKLPQSS